MRVVVHISAINRATAEAISFALSLSKRVTAVYIELEPDTADEIKAQWQKWYPSLPLAVVPSPLRATVAPLLKFLDEADEQADDDQQAVLVLPEIVVAKWWQRFLHNHAANLIKDALLYNRRRHGYQRVIIDVPYHLYR